MACVFSYLVRNFRGRTALWRKCLARDESFRDFVRHCCGVTPPRSTCKRGESSALKE